MKNDKLIMAERSQELLSDDTFKNTIEKIRSYQASIFLNPASSTDEREEAHAIVKALGKIESLLRSQSDEKKWQDKRQERLRG